MSKRRADTLPAPSTDTTISRRDALRRVGSAAAAATVLAACEPAPPPAPLAASRDDAAPTAAPTERAASALAPPAAPAVLEQMALGFPWTTLDPFLFCVHHMDHYPAGDARMAPATSLAGRQMGRDFSGKDGWSMYHGDAIPGFPSHPHRGFETITLARQGYIDHADSLGATARFGQGDVQWMTAGRGVVHSEMFPLVHQDRPNPTELFQIWLNLPRASKMVEPHFTMMWRDAIPRHRFTDAAERVTEVVAVAGDLGARRAPAPPPRSWAADPAADIAIWTIRMAPGAAWTAPPARPGVNRTLYFFRGAALQLAERALTAHVGVRVDPTAALPLRNDGADEVELLLLQGRPIGEPVARRGPFVMNTPAELVQAQRDYQRTGFGGWPWAGRAPAHPRDRGRFAIHADGREEHAEG